MKKYELYMKPTMVWDQKLTYRCEESDSVIKFLLNTLELQHRDREVFVLLALNSVGDIIGMNEVSVGSLNSTHVHPRELAKFLILCNASAFIMVHNHPSGNANPSEPDLYTTKRLILMSQIMGIKLLDHIIVGDNEGYSMKANGEIDSMDVEVNAILETKCS